MNALLNTAATGFLCFAIFTLAWTMWWRGHRRLAVGAGIWASAFAVRMATIIADSVGERYEWMEWVIRDYAWAYRFIAGVTLLAGIAEMQHQVRGQDVVTVMEAHLEERVNGTLDVGVG